MRAMAGGTQHNRSAKRCEDTNWSTRRSTWSPLRGTSRCQGTANSFHRDESTAQTHPEPHVQCQRDTVATKGRTAYTQHTQDHTHQRLYKTLRWNLASKTAPDATSQDKSALAGALSMSLSHLTHVCAAIAVLVLGTSVGAVLGGPPHFSKEHVGHRFDFAPLKSAKIVAPPAGAPVVTTSAGAVWGTRLPASGGVEVNQFLGIPFATANR